MTGFNFKFINIFVILCILFVGLSTVNATDVYENDTLNLNNNLNDGMYLNHDNQDEYDFDYNENINSEEHEKFLSASDNYDYYVNSNSGDDKNSGNSTKPYKTINRAINVAKSGQRIYLYNGNYNLNNNLPTLTKSLSFTGENQKNTIINGNGKYTIFTVSGSTLTLNNLKMTRGNGTYGGAIKVKTKSNVIINNCYFQNNRGVNGGVIGCVDDYANLSISNSYFINNTAGNYGGAILKNGIYSNLVITNSYFDDNIVSNKGGAIYIGGETVAKISGTFNRNTAVNGGAIYTGALSKSNIINSNFNNNKAKDTSTNSSKGLGGAVNLAAGDHNITSSNFTSNNAKIGGAVSVNSARPVIISKSRFDSNHASNHGGAIYNYGDGASNDCNFTNNYAENIAGGAIYEHGTSDSYNITNSRFIANKAYNPNKSTHGGAVSFAGEFGRYIIKMSYFERNQATYGGAITTLTKGITCNIFTTQFRNNTANYGGAIQINKDNTKMNIYYSNFTNNLASVSGGAISYNGRGSNSIIDYDNFISNTAQSMGGAIHVQNNSILTSKQSNLLSNSARNGKGGAIFSNSSTLVLSVMNIKNNIAKTGSAIYNIENNISYMNKSCLINNNIYSNKYFDARFNWWGANNKNNTSSEKINASFPVVFVSSVKTSNYNKTSNITSFKVLLDVYHYNETGQLHVLDQDIPYITVTLNHGLGKYTFNKQKYIIFNLKGNYLRSNNILVATLDSQVNNISSYKANYIKIDSYPKTPRQQSTFDITASIYQIDDTKLDCETQIVFKINEKTVNVTDLLGKTGTNNPTTRIKVINGNIKIRVKLPYLNVGMYNISITNIGHGKNTSLLCERSETIKLINVTSTTSKTNNIIEADDAPISSEDDNQEEGIIGEKNSTEYICDESIGDNI